ncbi:MAG: acyl-CoA thioesterase [Flavobacteriales bacterium]|nr:acyl-CoA thioesterase [Flavobacteriales bacterium]
MKKVKSEYKIGIGDINYGGHMGNDKALLVFHNARISFLEHFGFSEASIGDEVGIILSEANIKFKKEVFLHDELEIEVWISKMEGIRWTLTYVATRKSDNKEVFNGTTLMISYNYKTRKVSPIPDEFINKTFK